MILCAETALSNSSLRQSPRSRVLTGAEFWPERVERYTIKWHLFLNGPPADYLERVAQRYIRNLGKESMKKEKIRKDEFEREIASVAAFQEKFRHFEAEILQEDGVGEKLEKAVLMSKNMGEVICWLEDLLYQSLVGRISFEATYLGGRFLYQKT